MKEAFNKYYRKLFEEAINDLKTKNRRVRQIPNLLTIARLFAPFFIIPTAIIGNVKLIGIFVILFSITDALDGFIARRFNLISELGKDLDAVCDKVFAVTLLIGASCFEPALLVNFILEVLIAAINTKAKLKDCAPKSLFIGKAKTCFLYTLIGIGFLNNYLSLPWILISTFILTTIMQLATAITYMFKYRESANSTIKSKIQY